MPLFSTIKLKTSGNTKFWLRSNGIKVGWPVTINGTGGRVWTGTVEMIKPRGSRISVSPSGTFINEIVVGDIIDIEITVSNQDTGGNDVLYTHAALDDL